MTWDFKPERSQFLAGLNYRAREGGGYKRHLVFKAGYSPSEAQSVVLTEALNIHGQTGMTPAQLQARVAELEGALRHAVTLAEDDNGVDAESHLWSHLLKWGRA